LSDIDGVYTADPHTDPDAKLIPVIKEVDDSIMALAGNAGSSLGTGGMITKLQAAKICLAAGCTMIITNGADPDNLYWIMDGEPVGTAFIPEE